MSTQGNTEATFPKLRRTARIQRFSDMCCIVDQLDGNLRQFHPAQGLVLSLCTGNNSISDIARILHEGIGLSSKGALSIVFETIRVCQSHLNMLHRPSARPLTMDFRPFLYSPSPRDNAGGPVPLEKPIEIILRLTEKCNFRCVYCFHGGSSAPRSSGPSLSLGDCSSIIEQAAELGVIRFTVTGGEPMLSDHFLSVVRQLMQHDMFPYVSTNGSFINRETAKALASTGLRFMQVSLDTGEETLFNGIVGRESEFKKVRRGIAALVSSSISVRVKAVVLPSTVTALPSLIGLCTELGVSRIVLDQFMPSRHVPTGRRFLLSQSDRMNILRHIEKARDKKDGDLQIVNNTYEDLRWSGPDEIAACGGMLTAMTIHPNGDVGVCEMLPDIPDLNKIARK